MKINRFKIALHTSKGQFQEMVDGESIELGRNVSADLPVMASGVSRSHLKVFLVDGVVKIKDLGSTNGTYIKGMRIEAHKEVSYELGTRISLGQAGCFIRVELAEEDLSLQEVVSKESTRSGFAEEELKQTNAQGGDGDPSLMDSLLNIAKPSADSVEKKLQKKANAHLEQADQLIKKRIAEAEDSIRKGMQKARVQAKEIAIEARNEADMIKAKAQMDKNKMLSGLEEEISSSKKEVVENLNKMRAEQEKELTALKLEFEAERAESKSKLEAKFKEAEALVSGSKDEIASLNAKRDKVNLEIQDLLKKKNQARQDYKEIEIKLSSIDETHQIKTKSLESELSFFNKEIDRKKEELNEVLAKHDQEKSSYKGLIDDLISETEELSQTYDHLKEDNLHLVQENEDLNKSIEEAAVQKKYKIADLESVRTEIDKFVVQRDELEDEIASIKAFLEESIAEKVHRRKTLKDLKDQAEHVSKTLEQVSSDHSRLSLETADLNRNLELLKSESRDKKNEFTAAKHEFETLKRKKFNLEEEIENRKQNEEQKIAEMKKNVDLDLQELILVSQKKADDIISLAETKRAEMLAKAQKSCEETEAEKADLLESARNIYIEADSQRQELLEATQKACSEKEDEKNQLLEEAKIVYSQAKTKADAMLLRAKETEKDLVESAERVYDEAASVKKQILNESEEKRKQIIDDAHNEKERLLRGTEDLYAEAEIEKQKILESFKAEHAQIVDKAYEERKTILEGVDDLYSNAQAEKERVLREADLQTCRILEEAEEEREKMLADLRETREAAEVEHKVKLEEFEIFQVQEKERLNREVEDHSKKSKIELENSLAEIKVARTRELEESLEEQQRLLDTYRSEYAESWSTEIVFKAQEYFERALNEDEIIKAKEDLKAFAKAVIEEQNPDAELEVKGFMKFDPELRERKIRKFKRIGAFAALAVFLMALSPYVVTSMKNKAQEIAESSEKASEERVANMEKERELLTSYTPDKKDEYLLTYVDRVMHTSSYVENELSQEYREDWFLSLDTFFVEDLILSDETIVTFISKETNLIKSLRDLRDSINAQFVDEGVERMAALEDEFLTEVRKLLKDDKKFEKFQSFKKSYYLKAFPFEEKRSLASEPEDL